MFFFFELILRGYMHYMLAVTLEKTVICNLLTPLAWDQNAAQS